MISEQLPPLPEPFMELHREIAPHVYAAWAGQMRTYAAAAIAEMREDAALAAKSVLQTQGVDWSITEKVLNAIRSTQPDEEHDGNPSF